MDLGAQLQQAQTENARLREENEMKSDFLSIVVHQLRTPLSATKWIFKMMMDGDLGALSAEQKTIIERGYQSNEHMIRILAEIASANHLSEWRLKFKPEPMSIALCIDKALAEFSEEANAKHVALRFVNEGKIPPVLADKEKILLVLENILENSIKYNRPGGSVTIRTEAFKDKLIISVADTGPGIPLDEQKNIFTKFFRASNVKQEKGTGLGLFIGKQIIESHHGTIWFESTPNIGTTFFISLPLATQ